MDCTMYAARVKPALSRQARKEVRTLLSVVDEQADWIDLVQRGEYPLHNPQRSIALAQHQIAQARARIAELRKGRI